MFSIEPFFLHHQEWLALLACAGALLLLAIHLDDLRKDALK